MSNLGGYQWLTTIAKKVGGPFSFVAGLMILGAAICAKEINKRHKIV